ncbi:MAG: DUF192 domain-containing protein [Acidobacteria bacterium]|nr:DUF192 domain-containing protein [Acidobacteriota bacterium]
MGRAAEPHALWTADRARIVATSVELATDSASRNRGLLGRDGLADGVALVIAPCWAVHTIGMRFPIDIVHVARDGRIVKVRRSVQPWRMSAALGAFATIEMAVGAIGRAGLEPGMRLIVRGA